MPAPGSTLMRRPQRRLSLLLLTAALVPAAFLVASYRSNRAAGLPLDDSWIHLRYADSLAQGYRLSLNRGEPTPGATSPLWVALIAGAIRMGISPLAAGQAISIAFNVLAVLAAYHLAVLVIGARGAWIAAALCCSSGILAWSAGAALEVGLFNFLSLHALRLHVANTHGRWRSALAEALLIGLAIWARPEAVGLLAVLTVSNAWACLATGVSRRRAFATFGQSVCQAALAIAIAAPYSWFSQVTIGRPLPSTFYVKAGAPFSFEFVGQCLVSFVETLASESPLVALAAGLGIAVTLARMLSRPRQVSLMGWVVGLPMAYGIIGNTEAGANFGRHFYILIPGVMVLAALGIRATAHLLVRLTRRPSVGGHIVRVAALVLVMDLLWHAYGRGQQFVLNVKNINDMQVAAAAWVRDNVSPRHTVAVNDIGAIAFHADRPIMDLRGIATPEILPFLERYGRPGEPTRDSGVLEFLEQARPDYLLVFPEWYPRTLAALQRRGIIERVAAIRISHNITCGSDTLLVLRARWSR